MSDIKQDLISEVKKLAMIDAAKDEAAREAGYQSFSLAEVSEDFVLTTTMIGIINRAMEIYAERVNGDTSYWCIVKYSNNTPLYYCGYFGKYSDTKLLPAISSDFDQAVKCITKQAADNLLKNLKKHAPITSENFVIEEHMYIAKTTKP